jgi:hypothetical protein
MPGFRYDFRQTPINNYKSKQQASHCTQFTSLINQDFLVFFSAASRHRHLHHPYPPLYHNTTITTTMASRVNVDACKYRLPLLPSPFLSSFILPTSANNTKAKAYKVSSASYLGRSGAQSLIDGILYNSRQQAAEARAAKKAAAASPIDTDAASVSSFSSTSKLLPSKDAKSKKLNGTDFDVQKLKDQALKSQIRISI